MSKQAIGIVINGTDLKIAHLVREKRNIAVSFLETASLPSDLETGHSAPVDEAERASQQEREIFSIDTQEASADPVQISSSVQENANQIYSLLKKFGSRRGSIACNIPASIVNYQELNTTLDYDKNVFKGNLLKKIGQWKSGFNSLEDVHVLERRDGTLVNVSLDAGRTPAILSILEQVNGFFNGNLELALMEPNELALVNLARKSYQLQDPNEINVIIQVEKEFSRIIFMCGKDLLTVSPLITEGISPEIDQIIYSKILFEIDNLNISKISNILLASHAITNESKRFFEQQFSQSRVGFIVSQPLAEYLTSQFSREDLSEYAVAIALAWKVLDEKDENFTTVNFIPKEILDRQRVLKLSAIGYSLLALLGASAFVLTWLILSQQIQISTLNRQNDNYEEQIRNNQQTVMRVQQLEEHINNLSQSLQMSDSLEYGYDHVLEFLDKTNTSVRETRNIWIENIRKNTDGFSIRGSAPVRKNIPTLSNTMGEAILRRVNRRDWGERQIFAFEMDVDWPVQEVIPDSAVKEPTSLIPNAEIDSTGVVLAHVEPTDSQTTHQTLMKDSTVNEFIPGDQDESVINESLVAVEPDSTQAVQDVDPAPLPTVNSFTIRLYGYRDSFLAEQKLDEMKRVGIDAFIYHYSSDQRYCVCTGQYSSMAQAHAQIPDLHRRLPGIFQVLPLSEKKSFQVAQNSLPDYLMSGSGAQLAIENNGSLPQPRGSQESQIKDSVLPIHYAAGSELARSEGGFMIRCSAHAAQVSARREAELFRERGIDAKICVFDERNPEIPFWICLGPFPSMQQARQKIDYLQSIISRTFTVIKVSD
jgi:cell division protein FtsB